MNIQTITTTQLRTKSSELVSKLSLGIPVTLIHRSKIIATISPVGIQKPKVFDSKKLSSFLKTLPKTTQTNDLERETLYNQQLKNKHVENLS